MVAHKRRRALLVAVAAMCGVLLAGAAIATRGFGVIEASAADSRERAAQERCERDVVARLMSPSTAKLSDVTVTGAQLDPEVIDLFSLIDGPLRGLDRSRITVQSVQGVVEAPSEVGGTLHDAFTCRAYFVDHDLTDTLVVFDHDH